MQKSILVTGSEGFIGSQFTEHMLRLGYEVRAFVLYNSFNSIGWLDHIDKEYSGKLTIISGDIRDYHALRKAMEGVDWVVHLAALISVPYSYETPSMYVDVNVKGTLNVLQAAKDSRIEKLIVISSSEVYGTAQYIPIDEKHPLQAQSPYSASKIAAEKMAEAFYRTYDLPVCIVRPFNTYGPRQSLRAVIPNLIRQCLDGNVEIRLGNLAPTRDFVYVKDLISAFEAILRASEVEGEVFNVASQREISIGDLANKIVALIRPGTTVIEDQTKFRPGKSEVFRLKGAHEKLRRYTDWSPSYFLEEGLPETIDWFRQFREEEMYQRVLHHI